MFSAIKRTKKVQKNKIRNQYFNPFVQKKGREITCDDLLLQNCIQYTKKIKIS